jgi:transposase-like protein
MSRKRRAYTAEFKFQVAMEYLTGKKGRGQILREYEISDSVLERWYRKVMEEGHEIFAASRGTGPRENEQRIAELERMVGRLTMELGAAKKVSEWLRFHS